MITKTIDFIVPKNVSVAQGTLAMEWLYRLMNSDAPDAAQARVVWRITRGLSSFAEMGAKGGKQRAANLTASQRSASAKKAAAARWAK